MVDEHMIAKKSTDRLVKYLREWCSNPNNDLRADWEKELRKCNRQNSKQALSAGSLEMWFWAHWHAQHGLLAVIEGDPSGWASLELSFKYRWWRMQIDTSMTQVSEAALLLAHAIAIGDANKSAWLAEYQTNSLRNQSSNLWKFSSFGLYGLELWSKGTGNPSQLEELGNLENAPKLSNYAAILEHWDDQQKLADAIVQICDYHLKQALTQAGYPEFEISPYNLLPIEFLALSRVRALSDMPTPRPEHPLLRSEFVNPPEIWSHPNIAADAEVLRLVQIAGLSE